MGSGGYGRSWHHLGQDGFAQLGAAEAEEFACRSLGRVEGVFDGAGFAAPEAFLAAKVGCRWCIVSKVFYLRPEV